MTVLCLSKMIYSLLDISGYIFKLSRDDLMKANLFADILTDCQLDASRPDTLRFNRSPILFNHIQGYLIDPVYPYPRKYHKELDYYGIHYDINELYDNKRELSEKITELERRISKLEKVCPKICPCGSPSRAPCKNTWLSCYTRMYREIQMNGYGEQSD